MSAMRLLLPLLLACTPAPDRDPPANKACTVARRMALPNLECDPLATNLGWMPDTCICQLATKTGDVRVPTQVIWVKAGLTDPPEVKSVYNVPQAERAK